MWDLVSWPGNELGPPALGMQSLSHWTTREVLAHALFSPLMYLHSTIIFCLVNSYTSLKALLNDPHTPWNICGRLTTLTFVHFSSICVDIIVSIIWGMLFVHLFVLLEYELQQAQDCVLFLVPAKKPAHHHRQYLLNCPLIHTCFSKAPIQLSHFL